MLGLKNRQGYWSLSIQQINNESQGPIVRGRHLPLHVPALGSTQGKNALLGHHVQRHWVNALQQVNQTWSVPHTTYFVLHYFQLANICSLIYS